MFAAAGIVPGLFEHVIFAVVEMVLVPGDLLLERHHDLTVTLPAIIGIAQRGLDLPE